MRVRGLLCVLAMAALTAALARFKLTSVPSYESGLAVALLAAPCLAILAARRARLRPTTVDLRWGLLESSPGEQVLSETRASLALGLVLVALPLPALLSVAAGSDCQVFAGLPVYFFITLPAAFAGSCAGTLAGSLTRRASLAGALLVVAALGSALDDLLEFLAGPRVVLHDFFLGPLTASAYTGFDAGLTLPSSVIAHRAWTLVVSAALLALAAVVRARADAPPLPEGASDADGGGAWQVARSTDALRARFLLAHHGRAARRALALACVLVAPFLLMSDAAGITSGRGRLERALSMTVETEHFRLHCAPGSSAEAHLPRLAVELEHAWTQVTGWLGTSPEWKVDAWLHPDAATMQQLTGARGYLFASPWRHEFHVLADRRRVRALRHELIHVLAADHGSLPFRASLAMGLTEGLATALDEGFARDPASHAQVAAAARAGLVPPARDLLSITGFARRNMDASYRASASLVGFLILRQGPGPVLRAYATGDLAATTGMSLDEMDAAWKAFLIQEVPVERAEAALGRERFDPARHPNLASRPCARLGERRDALGRDRADLLAREGLPGDAAEAYCDVPGWAHDPEILEAAAIMRLRQGRRTDALALTDLALERLSRTSSRRDPVSRLRIRLLAAEGRTDEAARALDAWEAEGLAPTPDEPRLERAAILSPWAREYAEAVLASPPDDVTRLAALLDREPGAAPVQNQMLARLAASRPLDPARVPVALALARSTPGPLAARRLIEMARAFEEDMDWATAGRLAREAGAQPGLTTAQRLEIEDLAGRAALAPTVRLRSAARPAGRG